MGMIEDQIANLEWLRDNGFERTVFSYFGVIGASDTFNRGEFSVSEIACNDSWKALVAGNYADGKTPEEAVTALERKLSTLPADIKCDCATAKVFASNGHLYLSVRYGKFGGHMIEISKNGGVELAGKFLHLLAAPSMSQFWDYVGQDKFTLECCLAMLKDIGFKVES